MNNFRFVILIILFAFSLPCMYGGCVVIYSSGDFESQTEQPQEDESSGGFEGLTSQAAITPANAESLAAGAFAGGLSGTASQSLKLSQRSYSGQTYVFRPLKYPLILVDCLRRIELDVELNMSGLSSIITESNSLEGSCGGSLAYTLTFDRISGKFSGDILFADYCDDGVEISGDTDVDGTFEATSGVFETAAFSFDNLSDDSRTLDGEISLDLSDTPLLADLAVYSKDNQTGKVYWLKNYSLNLFEFFNRIEIEIFGTFYHPDNGFVTATTSEPFMVFDEDDWPSSGRLVIRGDGATRAQLIAIDELQYRVEADTDGDGTFDWGPKIFRWTDL
jgi:hypothetical protein